MARQVLENGVVLPAEYSDDWYDDMTSNLTKLDDVIGSDSEKLSSADVGAAALSNNYNDLDNLPTIPTVNDATLTIQKNGVDVQTFTANASSNVTANITVPTKTSDLTNDSNFVDTSNPAVASGITSAKVTDYDTHIADTDIHVTTADKSKWNNGVSQAYVLRYSSSSVTDNSTIAYSTLDNIDNIKSGDKIIDLDGKIFSVVSVDTANQTVTVGTALIDLALDGNVVHKSGNETLTGIKTFRKDLVVANTDTTANTPNLSLRNYNADIKTTETTVQTIMFSDKNAKALTTIESRRYSNGNTSTNILCYNTDTNNNTVSGGIAIIKSPTDTNFAPNTNNAVTCGRALARWSKIYGTEYYYGSNNVEFSTKFVTTDTTQTISGNKTFSSNVNVYNSDSSTDTANIILKNSKAERGSTTNIGEQNIFFLDKDNAQIGNIKCEVDSNGYSNLTLQCSDINNTSSGIQVRKTATGVTFQPTSNSQCYLGQSTRKWYSTYTNKINGVEPSSLSLPTDNLSNIIDISSYMTILDGSSANTYQAPGNGYISITMNNCSGVQAYITSFWGHQVIRPSSGGVRFFMPICKNMTANILIFGGTIDNARFIPCQGNV